MNSSWWIVAVLLFIFSSILVMCVRISMDKMARLANVPGLTRCILIFCSIYEIVILLEFFFTACKPGRITKKIFWLFCKLPRMKCVILMLEEGLSKVSQRNCAISHSIYRISTIKCIGTKEKSYFQWILNGRKIFIMIKGFNLITCS